MTNPGSVRITQLLTILSLVLIVVLIGGIAIRLTVLFQQPPASITLVFLLGLIVGVSIAAQKTRRRSNPYW